MAIWTISFDSDTYEHLDFVRTDIDRFQRGWANWFKGEPVSPLWQPAEVILSDDGGLPGDFPSLSGTPPIFTVRALRILSPLVSNCIEALPLNCENVPLYAINVIKVIDCLDHDHSQIERFFSGRIMRVEKYVFKPACIGQVHMFKIPEQVSDSIFVSDTFKATVEDHHLRGMVFTEVFNGGHT